MRMLPHVLVKSGGRARAAADPQSPHMSAGVCSSIDMTMRRGYDFRPTPPHLLTSAHSRKRVRDSDDSEFMPISKKLNNLHLEEGTAIADSACRTDACCLTAAPYQPCLPLDQNPVYYEINRVLFEAHQMRRGRSRNSDQ